MPTRNPIKAFFITFPQWNEDIETVKEFPSTLPVDVDYLMIARESHQDGGIHFHMAIKLSNGISKARLLKFLIANYPDDYKRIDVQPLKSWKDTFMYLTKEDECPYEFGERPLVCNNLAKAKKPWANNGEFLYESERLYNERIADAHKTINYITEDRLNVWRRRIATQPEHKHCCSKMLDKELKQLNDAHEFIDYVTLEDFRTTAWNNNLIPLHFTGF